MVTAAQKAKQEEEAAAAKAAESDTKADREVESASDDQIKLDNERRAARDAGEPLPKGESTAVSQPAGPDHSTTTDALGTERIVATGVQDGWTPAPVEASEEAIAKAKERNEREEADAEARREGRIDPVSGKLLSKEEWAKRDKGDDEDKSAKDKS